MGFAKSALRTIGWTLGALALAVGLVVTALPLWLRTHQAHRTVERVLTHLLNERVPGSVSVGRLTGSVTRDLFARDVVVRNPRGQLVGRAEWMSARWRPLALWRRHEIEELRARRPDVVLDRGRWRVRRAEAATPAKPGKGVLIDRIVADDGQVSWKSATFHHVSGVARLRSHSNLDVHAASTILAGLAWRASGVVGWGVTTPAWVATRFELSRPQRLYGSGEIFYTPGRLEGDIDELTIAAPVVTRLVGGRGPLRVQGGVRGGPDQLHAEANAAQGQRTLQLRARIDGAAHSAVVDARLRGVPRPIRLHAEARYDRGAVTVSRLGAAIGKSRLDGAGLLRGQRLHAAVDLRLAAAEARLVALRPAAPLRVHLELDGTARDLAVDARGGVRPGQLLLRARVDVPQRRGRGELVVHELRPVELVGRGPDFVVSGMLALDGRWAQRAWSGEAQLARVRVVYARRTVDEVAGAATLRLARAGEADIHWLTGRFAGKRDRPRLALSGLLRWRGPRLALTRANAAVGDSRWRGEADWIGDAAGGARAEIRADAVTLPPALVARFVRYRPPAPWQGHGSIAGTPNDFAIRLDVATELGPAALAARVRHDGATVELPLVDVRLGDSHLRGAARLGPARLTVSLGELVLQPPLIVRLVPALDPQWPIRLHGSADGPHDGVDVHLRVDAGPSITELDGRISVAQRRFRLTGAVDGLDVSVLHKSKTHAHGTLQLAADGSFAGGRPSGTLTVRDARGYIMLSPFYGGLVDARFDGHTFELTRVRVEVPGAKVAGKGGGTYDDFRVGYGVVITNALALRRVPRALRVVLGINSILPGRTIEGAVQKRPGKKIALHYRVLPIGFAQLAFLYRVVSGRFN